MPTLTELNLYPIKSCAGISLRTATVTEFGLMSDGVHDREWMVVDLDGNFLTQREHPAMARIVPRIATDALEVHAPGLPALALALDPPDLQTGPTTTVRIWDELLPARDCGDAAAGWFSEAIGTPCRLVRFHPQASHLASRRWTGDRVVQNRFSDGFPLLLISEESLDDLNQKLRAAGRAALPMNRFRPNLVIAGVDPFTEDYAATIEIGEVLLQPVKPCPRCPIPSVDQATGISGPNPLDILQTYRANPKVDGAITFGMNAILLRGDNTVLEVGQEIVVELAF